MSGKASSNIRRAIPSDSLGIARVHIESWKTTYKAIVPQDYLDDLSGELGRREEWWVRVLSEEISSSSQVSRVTFVAESDSEIVGFASGGKLRDPRDPPFDAELYAIYLLQGSQRLGLGRRLLHGVVREMISHGFRSLLVWVLADNPFRNFYASLGGKIIYSKSLEIRGKALEEIAYGWRDIRMLYEAAN